MTNKIELSLSELELVVAVEFEATVRDPGDWTTPPSGPEVEVQHAWLGVEPDRIDILPALNSLDLGLEDMILEELEDEEPDEQDADQMYEEAREREWDRYSE